MCFLIHQPQLIAHNHYGNNKTFQSQYAVYTLFFFFSVFYVYISVRLTHSVVFLKIMIRKGGLTYRNFNRGQWRFFVLIDFSARFVRMKRYNDTHTGNQFRREKSIAVLFYPGQSLSIFYRCISGSRDEKYFIFIRYLIVQCKRYGFRIEFTTLASEKKITTIFRAIYQFIVRISCRIRGK